MNKLFERFISTVITLSVVSASMTAYASSGSEQLYYEANVDFENMEATTEACQSISLASENNGFESITLKPLNASHSTSQLEITSNLESDNNYLKWTSVLNGDVRETATTNLNPGYGLRFELSENIDLSDAPVTVEFKININSDTKMRGIHYGNICECINFMHSEDCHRAGLTYFENKINDYSSWYDVSITYEKESSTKGNCAIKYKKSDNDEWTIITGNETSGTILGSNLPSVKDFDDVSFMELTIYNNVAASKNCVVLVDDIELYQGTKPVVPVVSSSSVSDGGTIAVDDDIKIIFDMPVAPDTINELNIVLSDENGIVSTDYEISADHKTVTVTPVSDLVYSTEEKPKEYTLIVQNVKAEGDNAGIMKGTYSITFYTETEPDDSTAPDEPIVPDDSELPLGGVAAVVDFDDANTDAEPTASIGLDGGFESVCVNDEIIFTSSVDSLISFENYPDDESDVYLKWDVNINYTGGNQPGSGIRFNLPQKIDLDGGDVTIKFKYNFKSADNAVTLRGIHLGDNALTCDNFMHQTCCHRAALNYWTPTEDTWYDIQIVYSKIPGQKDSKVTVLSRPSESSSWSALSGNVATPNAQSINEIDFIEFTVFNNSKGVTKDAVMLFDDFAVSQQVKPSVKSTTVADGDRFVEPGKDIDIEFDMAVLSESINKENITLLAEDGSTVDGLDYELEISDDGKTVTIAFADGCKLGYLKDYFIKIENVIANAVLKGKMDDPVTISFRTLGKYEVMNAVATTDDETVDVSFDLVDYVKENSGNKYVIVMAFVEKGTNTIYDIQAQSYTSIKGVYTYKTLPITCSFDCPQDFSKDKYEVKVFVWDGFVDSINHFATSVKID